ncbi:MAG: hydroxyacylglutathione hydrolase [Spirulina sp. SIO3F2]|nr:hydroxyacylglutathione hydrolase [Spirulina sp. SIO3F2]
MEIIRLPMLFDNYTFLLCDQRSQTAVVVDPAEAQPVLAYLNTAQLNLVAIWNTHHHHDHIGGNRALLRQFPELCIYGSEADRGRIPGQQRFLAGGDRVEFAGRTAQVLFVPGHTWGHIAYYLPPIASSDPGELFCGDTLFAGGCGRLFEGTPAQMLRSLQQLRQLPANTRIWCAHEYTLKNFEFALSVAPNDPQVQQRYAQVKQARHQRQPTIPTTLAIEQQTNLFLRWDDPAIQAQLQCDDALETFTRLRSRKDRF